MIIIAEIEMNNWNIDVIEYFIITDYLCFLFTLLRDTLLQTANELEKSMEDHDDWRQFPSCRVKSSERE